MKFYPDVPCPTCDGMMTAFASRCKPCENKRRKETVWMKPRNKRRPKHKIWKDKSDARECVICGNKIPTGSNSHKVVCNKSECHFERNRRYKRWYDKMGFGKDKCSVHGCKNTKKKEAKTCRSCFRAIKAGRNVPVKVQTEHEPAEIIPIGKNMFLKEEV